MVDPLGAIPVESATLPIQTNKGAEPVQLNGETSHDTSFGKYMLQAPQLVTRYMENNTGKPIRGFTRLFKLLQPM